MRAAKIHGNFSPTEFLHSPTLASPQPISHGLTDLQCRYLHHNHNAHGNASEHQLSFNPLQLQVPFGTYRCRDCYRRNLLPRFPKIERCKRIRIHKTRVSRFAGKSIECKNDCYQCGRDRKVRCFKLIRNRESNVPAFKIVSLFTVH